MTFEQLRTEVKEKGIGPGFILILYRRLGGNVEALAQLVPKCKGLIGCIGYGWIARQNIYSNIAESG